MARKSKRTDRDEILELWKKALEDFPTFCTFFRIVDKDGKEIRLSPDNWYPEQIEFNKNRSGRDVVLKPRQIGFTTLELLRDLWFALTNPGSTTLIVAQNTITRDESFSRIKECYNQLLDLGEDLGIELVPEIQTRKGLKSGQNNQQVFSFRVPGAPRATKIKAQQARDNVTDAKKHFRGDTYQRLHLTEVAFWNETHETCRALFNSIGDSGEIVIESTPDGPRGFFYDLIMSLKNGERTDYKFHFFPFWKHANYTLPVPKDFKVNCNNDQEQLLQKLGCSNGQIMFFRNEVLKAGLTSAIQEYPIDEDTCFKASDNTYISHEVLDRLIFNAQPTPLSTIDSGYGITWNVYASPQEGSAYILAADTAHGVNKDYSAAYVIDRDTAEIVACGASNKIKTIPFAHALDALGRQYNNALLAPEYNQPGNSVVDRLVENQYPNLYYDKRRSHFGWLTEVKSRSNMIATLGEYIELNGFKVACPMLAQQLRHLIRTDQGRVEAAPGKNDDRIIAFAIALRIRHEMPWVIVSDGGISVPGSGDMPHNFFGTLNGGIGYA